MRGQSLLDLNTKEMLWLEKDQLQWAKAWSMGVYMKSLIDRIRDSKDQLVFLYKPTGDLLVLNVSGDVSEVETSKELMLKIMDMSFSEIVEKSEFLSVL